MGITGITHCRATSMGNMMNQKIFGGALFSDESNWIKQRLGAATVRILEKGYNWDVVLDVQSSQKWDKKPLSERAM